MVRYQAAGSSPQGLVSDPSGRFLYVVNSGSQNINMYSIATNEEASEYLTPLTPGAIPSNGTSPVAIAIEPNGRYAYVANLGNNTVSLFSINQNSGVLTYINSYNTGINPIAIAIGHGSNNNYVYVVNNGSSTISMYQINESTGTLTSLGADISSGGSGSRAIAIR